MEAATLLKRVTKIEVAAGRDVVEMNLPSEEPVPAHGKDELPLDVPCQLCD